MATYKVSLFDALWRFPRVVIWMLIPAYAERQGQPAGMSPIDRASSAARREMRNNIQTYYDIVDDPLDRIGWQAGEPPAWIKSRYLS